MARLACMLVLCPCMCLALRVQTSTTDRPSLASIDQGVQGAANSPLLPGAGIRVRENVFETLLFILGRSSLRRPFRRTAFVASSRPQRSASIKMNEFQGNLEKLMLAKEDAVRSENYAEAARLRDEIADLQASSPRNALEVVRRRKATSLRENFFNQSIEQQFETIETLKAMAMPPLPADGAEDALHELLLRNKDTDVHSKIAETLAYIWMQSGNHVTDTVLLKGVQMLQEGKFRSAMHFFDQVVDMAPEFAEGWSMRGNAWLGLKEYQYAIDDFKQAVRLKPRHFRCLANLVKCHVLLENGKEADKWADRLTKVYPEDQEDDDFVEVRPDELEDDGTEKRLLQYVVDASKAFRNGRAMYAKSSNHVFCDWDVHQIEDETTRSQGSVLKYVFRNRFKLTQPQDLDAYTFSRRTALCRGHFLVLRFTNGAIFPIIFDNDNRSDQAFTLQPKSEQKLCWNLVSEVPLQSVVGGSLFRLSDDPAGETVTLPVVHLDDEVQVSIDGVDGFVDGYKFTGVVDLRKFPKNYEGW